LLGQPAEALPLFLKGHDVYRSTAAQNSWAEKPGKHGRVVDVRL
jgi:hypothetical protein